MTFSSPVREARVEAADVVSKIALIELPHNMWPGLIEALIENMKSPNPYLRQSTVITLGELCEAIVSHLLIPPSHCYLSLFGSVHFCSTLYCSVVSHCFFFRWLFEGSQQSQQSVGRSNSHCSCPWNDT